MRARTLLCLLVVLWLAVPVPAQTAATRTPLSIGAIVLPDGMPEWHDIDPSTVRVQVTIENTGIRPSAGYELEYHWVYPDGRETSLDSPSSPSPGSTTAGDPLTPGASRTHTIDWEPYEGQVDEGVILVMLTETETLVKERAAFIPVHKIAVLGNSDETVLGPDGSEILPVKVRNMGNVIEEVSLSVTNTPARITAEFEDGSHLVPPGDTTVGLDVHYPFTGDLNDVSGLQVSIQAQTVSGLLGTAKTGLISLKHNTGPPAPAASVDGPSTTIFVDSGGTGDVPFVLNNKGTQTDGYTVTVAVDGDWSAGTPTVEGNPASRVFVAGGGSKTLLVPVTAPSVARSVSTVTLTATSDHGVVVSDKATVKTHGTDARLLSVALPSGNRYDGDDLSALVRVDNVGDVALQGATLRVEARFPDGTVLSADKALSSLGADRERTEELPLGKAPVAGTVALSATLDDGTRTIALADTGFVHLAGIEVEAPEPLAGIPGETLRYHTPPTAFQVTNGGNAPETVKVSVQGGTLVGQDTFSLAAGESRTVPVSQTLPVQPGDRTRFPVTVSAALTASPGRVASQTVNSLLDDGDAPIVSWFELGANATRSRETPLRIDAGDATAVIAAWVDVVHGGETQRVDLVAGSHWTGLWVPAAEGEHQLTPHARDRFGNVGTGPTRTVEVGAPPPPPPPGPPVLHTEVRRNGSDVAVFVETDATEVTLRVGGQNVSHAVENGTALIELDLGPGTHDVLVTALGEGGETEQTVQVVVDAPAPEPPNALSRLTPGPAVGLVALGLLLVGRRLRR